MFSDPEWILVYFLRLSHRLHLFSFWQIYQGLINLLWEGNSSQLSSSLGFRFSKIQKSLSWFLSSRYLNFGYFFVLVVLKEDQGIKLKPELVSSGRTLKQVVEQTNSYRISQLEFLTAYTTGRPRATWELHRSCICEERAKQTDETNLTYMSVSSGHSHFMKSWIGPGAFASLWSVKFWFSVKEGSHRWRRNGYLVSQIFCHQDIPMRVKPRHIYLFIYFVFREGRARLLWVVK